MARPSFTSWAYSPRRLTSRITEAQRAYDFDVILVQTPGLSVVLDTITGPFKIIDAVDLWYERYLSFDRAGKGRLLEHFRTPQVELQFYRRAADLTIASSLHDEAIMRADGHDPNSLLHVPVAFEPEPLAIECEEPNLLFAGASGLTNVDALDYFIGSVMPHVRNKMKDAKLLLLRSDEEVRQRFGSSPGVECLPDIDDVRDAYHKARVAVVPLRLGSGIKIKVLESLAFGVPTIVSPVASQGIDLKLYAQRDVTLDPERMAREVIDALSSESYRRELTRTAIETIRERYRPAVAYAPLMERLEREINRRRRRVPAQSEASGVASSSRG